MSAEFAQRRLMREIKKLQDEPTDGISGAPRDDNIMLWEAVIMGPKSTAWEGGSFKLTLQFTDDYPLKPPTVMFTSPMFHPNVYEDGKLCLDILEEEWSPIYNVSSLLTSIRSLLSDPNTDSPANDIAAMMFAWEKPEYDKRVRELVEHCRA